MNSMTDWIQRKSGLVIPIAVLLIGLMLTFVAVRMVEQNRQNETNARFIALTNVLAKDIQRRITQPVYGIHGARGVYAVKPSVSRQEFRAYVESRNLPLEFPGVQGFGFAERVFRKDLDVFVAAQRHDGEPGFAVQARPQANELYIVKFFHPGLKISEPLGLDWGSDPVRDEAVGRAISTGQATLSKPIEPLSGRGHYYYLFIVPVFKNGLPTHTLQQREQAIQGFLFAPIVVADVMQDIGDPVTSQADFALFDDSLNTPQTALFITRPPPANALPTDPDGHALAQHRYVAFRNIVVGGHVLKLETWSTPQFEALDNQVSNRIIILLGGTLLSLMLAVLIWLQITRREHAEAMARKMTVDIERLAQVVQHTSNIALITDPDMQITWVNDGFTQSYGYTLQEALGRKPSALLGSGKNDPGTLDALNQAVAAGQGCHVEILNITKAGHEIWVDLDVQPSWDATGKLTGFLEIGLDITSRRLAREQLRKTNAFLDRAEKIAGVGSWEVDLQTQALTWSEQMFHIYDLSPGKQPTQQESIDLFAPEERRRISVAARAAIKERKPWDLQLPLVTLKGRHIWVRSVGTVELENGQPVRLVGALQDVTSQKSAEEYLRSINTMMQSIVDNLPCGLSVFDANLHLVMHNMEFRRLLELPDHLFAGPVTTFESIIRYNAERGEYGPGDVNEHVARITKLAVHPVPHQMERVRHDGLSLEIRGAPMPGGGFITTYMDISERKKIDRLKDEFISTVSHELRTPLTSIFGSLKLLVGGVAGPLSPEVSNLIKIASQNSERLIRLINDVLDLEKMQSQKVEYKMLAQPLAPLIEQAIEATHAYAQQYDVTVAFEERLDQVLVSVDSDRIIQVLINLLSNAAKFSHAGGKVSVRMSRVDGYVRVSVVDRGPGIPQEFRSRIFERFSQADGSDRRQKGGSGLGLTICKGIIEGHQGRISFHSELGNGSEFYFELPVSGHQTA